MNTLLDIQNLSIKFSVDDGIVHAVNNIDLQIQEGEAIAVVGESGAGKSQIFQAVMGLLSSNAQATGSINFSQHSILNRPDQVLNPLRGRCMGMIFQDPMTSLNPYLTIGTQLLEMLGIHWKLSPKYSEGRSAVIEMLDSVKLREPEQCFYQYPHELSGGMRQRVVIAMALLGKPELLIADEPTTALDVTVQAEIMALLKHSHAQRNMAIVLITHDLPLAVNFCERIVVMYAGKIVESGKTEDILYRPQHPYTQALLAASPQNDLNEKGRLQAIDGNLPDPLNPVTTCVFKNRCVYVDEQCQQPPKLIEKNGHQLACFNPIVSSK